MASSPTPPPEKRQAFCSPILLIVIACVIAGAIAVFLVLRPNPNGKGQSSPTATPASQQ
ncbi:hypothetical protein [Tunturiibacter gelidoferens]|uniref:Uncharacterized protein n=3 Tax=Tunturiibacter TaxID=3154218 RepID=A0A7Y9NP92_9BACT|nr:hypothetical protein [Edaphobacter lichenicola]MBB5337694.1 hypothetical protein [Edaphobacter lichenicola]NYF53019.1 hypothetical protein [Edaphobacter lichenicola]